MRLNGKSYQTLFSSALLNGNLQSSRRWVVGGGAFFRRTSAWDFRSFLCVDDVNQTTPFLPLAHSPPVFLPSARFIFFCCSLSLSRPPRFRFTQFCIQNFSVISKKDCLSALGKERTELLNGKYASNSAPEQFFFRMSALVRFSVYFDPICFHYYSKNTVCSTHTHTNTVPLPFSFVHRPPPPIHSSPLHGTIPQNSLHFDRIERKSKCAYTQFFVVVAAWAIPIGFPLTKEANLIEKIC